MRYVTIFATLVFLFVSLSPDRFHCVVNILHREGGLLESFAGNSKGRVKPILRRESRQNVISGIDLFCRVLHIATLCAPFRKQPGTNNASYYQIVQRGVKRPNEFSLCLKPATAFIPGRKSFSRTATSSMVEDHAQPAVSETAFRRREYWRLVQYFVCSLIFSWSCNILRTPMRLSMRGLPPGPNMRCMLLLDLLSLRANSGRVIVALI